MPTRTFLNLPKEKRLRILKAAKKEFSRVPLEHAVIANIVKEAQIPRGSFYQYFDNIEDLFAYLTEYMYGLDKKKFREHMVQANNDVYEALKINFAAKIDKLSVSSNRQFRINVLKTFLSDANLENQNLKNILDPDGYIDIDFLPEPIRHSPRSKNLINTLVMIGKNYVQKYLMNTMNIEEVKSDYNEHIDFIKIGFSK